MKFYEFERKVYKFFNIDYPDSASSEEWEKIEDNMKTNHKVLHFIFDTFPEFFWPLKRACNSIREWVMYRTYRRYHIIKTDLEPGYYDADQLLLHGMFTVLKNYVEIECSHMFMWCMDNKLTKLEKFMSRFRMLRRFLDLRRFGMSYLKYDHIEGKEPSQFYEGELECLQNQMKWEKEVLDLYIWWTVTRPSRLNDMDVSGLSLWYDEYPLDGNIWKCFNNREGQEMWRILNKRNDEVEKKHNEEDAEMMIRLVKVRGHLWT